MTSCFRSGLRLPTLARWWRKYRRRWAHVQARFLKFNSPLRSLGYTRLLPMAPTRITIAVLAFALLAIAFLPATARAQHSDWLLGSFGLNGATQPPEGVYYQNMWSYYQASGSGFIQTGLKSGPLGQASLAHNINGSGSLEIFVDQNIVSWTAPLKILGANYGCFIDLPFAIVAASGAASLQPNLSLPRGSAVLPASQISGGTTKGSLADIYVEPINLGWHFKYLDLIASSGFFAPTGPYNPKANVNIGFGHWTGVFGLGGVVYADQEHTWSLSIYSHYLLYASQMGKNYQLGDVIPFEWGAGKTFNLKNDILKQITIGAVGYAQWQVTNNQIYSTPANAVAAAVVNRLEHTRSQIYAAGPGITALTKYGFFTLSYYEEFGAKNTPSGRQVIFSAAF